MSDHLKYKKNFSVWVDNFIKHNDEIELCFLYLEAYRIHGFGKKSVDNYLELLADTGKISVDNTLKIITVCKKDNEKE